MHKILLAVITATLLAGCSGHIYPPNMQFGKKCVETTNDTIVYSYVWMHKKGTELKANKETCELIKKSN
tara:strand:+ start:2443 stop:2649 length:207 start_codon:yes stop_codon:yes gene_type:complete